MAKICFLILMITLLGFNLGQAKSLYVIADVNAGVAPIETYDIQGSAQLLEVHKVINVFLGL